MKGLMVAALLAGLLEACSSEPEVCQRTVMVARLKVRGCERLPFGEHEARPKQIVTSYDACSDKISAIELDPWPAEEAWKCPDVSLLVWIPAQALVRVESDTWTVIPECSDGKRLTPEGKIVACEEPKR